VPSKRKQRGKQTDVKANPPSGNRWTLVALLCILSIASLLRVADLDGSPPGLNQDEAANSWNAYCLLKTGRDQHEIPWPIFYMRALGSNRTTPHIYATMPFQAIGGINVWTTRLPIALAGVFTVFMLYQLGKRLFGVYVGLAAAALLALNPWHIHLTRVAFGAALCPLIVTLVLYAMAWACLPVTDEDKSPRVVRAGLAGLVAGLGFYGYQAVRIFLPFFILSIILVGFSRWWSLLKSRRGALAICAFVLGFAAAFGPLAWKHVSDPEILKRGNELWAWEQEDTIGVRISKVLREYHPHFDPDFLFIGGDRSSVQSIAGWGQFHWYILPLAIVGLLAAAVRCRQSTAARILLCWVILYPIGDMLARHYGPHSLRSSPGLCGIILLAAFGTVAGCRWLWQRQRFLAKAAAAGLAIAVAVSSVRYGRDFFREYKRTPSVYHSFHVDLQDACKWLRPRFDRLDAVFCTVKYMNRPYIMILNHLSYDPSQWHADSLNVDMSGNFDVYHSFGKFIFLYGRPEREQLEELLNNGKPDRVAFIIRPGELALPGPARVIRGPGGKSVTWNQPEMLKPSHVIRRPDGAAVLWLCEAVI